MDGLTGKVSFDAAGFRSNFNLEIVELRKEGLTKVQNKAFHYPKSLFKNIKKKSAKISKWKAAVKVIELYLNCYDLKNAMNWYTINIFFALLWITFTNLENWAGMVMCPFN